MALPQVSSSGAIHHLGVMPGAAIGSSFGFALGLAVACAYIRLKEYGCAYDGRPVTDAVCRKSVTVCAIWIMALLIVGAVIGGWLTA